MRTFFGLASLGLFLTSAPVNAASLCNCCTTAVAESCRAVCGPVKLAPGQCIAMVDYAGEAMIADGDNPIYGISLLNLDIGDAMRPELEEVRRLLEDLRRGAGRIAKFRRGISERVKSMKPRSSQVPSAMRMRL